LGLYSPLTSTPRRYSRPWPIGRISWSFSFDIPSISSHLSTQRKPDLFRTRDNLFAPTRFPKVPL
jgi:hypothetical protein